MGEQQFPTAECTLAIAFAKFPPNLSALSSLGFDHISSSKNSVVALKTEGTDLSGHPHMSVEIRLNPKEAKLQYTIPKECDARIRRLHATMLFLRTLSLIPNAQADLRPLCGLALLPLELAEKNATLPYELLSKKHGECESQVSEARIKSQRLIRASEECTRRCAELEKQNSALCARTSKLEAVSDDALCGLVLDWLATHRGTFSAAHFSRENCIPPSRCEEGLGILLKSGAIRRASGRYVVEAEPAHEHFTTARHDLVRLAKNTANGASSRISAWISHKE